MSMEKLLERYTPEQREAIQAYWEVVRWTRQTGRIADGVKKTEMEFWEQFDPDVVVHALLIHADKYQNIREHYTRGIMRNLAVDKSVGAAERQTAAGGGGGPSAAASVKKNRFANFEQRNDWGYDAIQVLERLKLTGELDTKREELMKDPRFSRYLI